MPVATAKMFGSRMMSSASKPRLVDQQPIGRRGDRDLALDGVGLALLVEGHDDDGRAVAAGEPGLAEELGLALLDARSS